MNKLSIKSLIIASGVFGLSSGIAQAELLTIYGKVHVSGDYVAYPDSSDVAIGSNSSRIGFKGDKKLSHGFKGIWKFENEIDVSGESKPLSARNRYLGLKHEFGTVLVGYHDTPFKSFGGKAGVFHDTIGERRGILGAGNGNNKFNIRARNSVMYISPKLAGLEIRAMGSTGNDTSKSEDSNGVKSFSAVYKMKSFYVGAAYEDQSKLADTDGRGIRVGAGVKLGKTKINAMFENLSSDSKDEFSRNAYGGSVTHSLGNVTVKAQLFLAADNDTQSDTGGMLYALGADYKLAKSFTVYALYAGVNNQDNAKIVLAGSGHGEKYSPPNPGDNLWGVSGGMIYKF